MSYTTTTWTTVSVAHVKPDHVVVYTKTDGTERALDANMALIQINDTGGRRTILGVVDMNTCEVIPAPDVEGFVALRYAAVWAATRRIEMQPR